MKLAVVANCQSGPIGIALSGVQGVEVIPVPIQLYGRRAFEPYAANLEDALQDGAIVVSFKISDKFGNLTAPRLRERGVRVVLMTNIYFSGLHPDIMYLGNRLSRLRSPIGDYHSKIILMSYLAGVPESECRTRFNAKEYERLGYFAEYGKSAEILLQRDEGLDIRFAGFFLEMLRDVPCLYTFNHPTGVVFQEYGRFICDHLGLKPPPRIPSEMVPNSLSRSTLWPVYNEIAEAAGLRYRMPFSFRAGGTGMGRPFLDLDDFIAQSYAAYDSYGPRLRTASQVVEFSQSQDRKGLSGWSETDP